MDPMIDFVRDRTLDLQRVADDVRRERDLRVAAPSAAAATIAAAPLRLEAVAAPEPACDPCRPEATARHAA